MRAIYTLYLLFIPHRNIYTKKQKHVLAPRLTHINYNIDKPTNRETDRKKKHAHSYINISESIALLLKPPAGIILSNIL